MWQESVTVAQLDDFCTAHHIDPIDFIKCDTEGHEWTWPPDRAHIWEEFLPHPFRQEIGLKLPLAVSEA
jgi:hypothetical protein